MAKIHNRVALRQAVQHERGDNKDLSARFGFWTGKRVFDPEHLLTPSVVCDDAYQLIATLEPPLYSESAVTPGFRSSPGSAAQDGCSHRSRNVAVYVRANKYI